MLENYEIIPGKGVGNILLGMKRDAVEKILGQPDDKEDIKYEDGETSVTYYYYDLKIDLTFESDDDERLSFISVEGEEFHIKNQIKIGDTKEKVISSCKLLSFSISEEEDMSNDDEPTQILVALDEENINFWFTDNTLDEIQLGPFWQDDDTPIWPA